MIMPLGFINYFIKKPSFRLIYGLFSGLFLSYSMYGYEIYHIIIDCFVTYFFLVNFGRKVSAFFILIFSMSHLSIGHIYRMMTDYGGWRMDISGISMMYVVKFSAMCFSYEDGAKNDDEIKNSYMK